MYGLMSLRSCAWISTSRPGLDTGGQQHIVHGGQRKLRRIVGLAQMAQRKLFAALLNEVQNLGSAGPVVQMAAVAGDALL